MVELSQELLSVISNAAEEADSSGLFCVSLYGSASAGYNFVGTQVKSVNSTTQEGKGQNASAPAQLRLFVCLNPLSSNQSQLMFVKAVDDKTAIESFKAAGCQDQLFVIKVAPKLTRILSELLETHSDNFLSLLQMKGDLISSKTLR